MKGGRSRGAPRHRWVDNYPEGWAIAALEEICSVKRGASPRPAGDPRYFGGAFPWFKISDASAEPGRWLTTTEETVNEAGKARSVFLRAGALILSNSGTTGRPRFIGVDGCIHDGWLAFDNFKGVDPLYLFYVLSWHTDYLTHLADGSVQKNLNTSLLKGLEIGLPPIETQRAIAHILGTLDDKIELNRRMNRTLEAIARATFKSWFVDFGPVHAKAEGREPIGMDPETAALFPDCFQDSPLGKIPKGWNVKALAGIARYVNGRNFTKDATRNGRMVIRIAELNRGVSGSTVYNDVEAEPENTAYPDDILFAWSGSLGVFRWHEDEALINQHIFKVIPDGLPKWFVYFHLLRAMPYFRMVAAGKATTMGHIKRAHLADVLLSIPPAKLLSAVDEVVGPLYSRVHVVEQETGALERTRDVLLPYLLSGEFASIGGDAIHD